jgi:hypothetical protein
MPEYLHDVRHHRHHCFRRHPLGYSPEWAQAPTQHTNDLLFTLHYFHSAQAWKVCPATSYPPPRLVLCKSQSAGPGIARQPGCSGAAIPTLHRQDR